MSNKCPINGGTQAWTFVRIDPRTPAAPGRPEAGRRPSGRGFERGVRTGKPENPPPFAAPRPATRSCSWSTEETVILCRSADRRSKEKAMHDKLSARITAALERLAARVARAKRRLDPAPVNRQIGRILQQNQRAAARFTIVLEPAGFRVRVTCNTAFDDWAALSEGAYLLRPQQA